MATRGCRSLSELLACRGGVLLNRESPQARGLVLAYPSGSVQPRNLVRRRGDPTTITSAVTSEVGGSMGRAIHFPGTPDTEYVAATSVPWTNALPLSVSAWFRIHTLSSYKYLWNLTAYTGSETSLLSFARHNSGAMYYYEDSAARQTTWMPSADVWYHVVIVYQTSSVQLYLNGRSEAIEQPTAFSGLGSASLMLGNLASSQANSPHADISDFRVYDRALTEAEARALYDPRTRYDLYRVPPRSPFRKKPLTHARLIRTPSRAGCRNLSEVLACGANLSLNRKSPQARDLDFLFNAQAGRSLDARRRALRLRTGMVPRVTDRGRGFAVEYPLTGGDGMIFVGESGEVGSTAMRGHGDFSWHAVVRVESYRASLGNCGVMGAVSDLASAAGAATMAISGWQVGDGGLKFATNDNYWHEWGGEVVPLNTTSYVTVTRRGTTIKFYLNGLLTHTHTDFSEGTDNNQAFSLCGFWTSGGSRADESTQMAGPVMEARVYSRQLTDEEVFALYDPRTRYDLYMAPRTRVAATPRRNRVYRTFSKAGA